MHQKNLFTVRAGCRRSVFGVFWRVFGATKRVEDAAKTTFQKYKNSENRNKKSTPLETSQTLQWNMRDVLDEACPAAHSLRCLDSMRCVRWSGIDLKNLVFGRKKKAVLDPCIGKETRKETIRENPTNPKNGQTLDRENNQGFLEEEFSKSCKKQSGKVKIPIYISLFRDIIVCGGVYRLGDSKVLTGLCVLCYLCWSMSLCATILGCLHVCILAYLCVSVCVCMCVCMHVTVCAPKLQAEEWPTTKSLPGAVHMICMCDMTVDWYVWHVTGLTNMWDISPTCARYDAWLRRKVWRMT